MIQETIITTYSPAGIVHIAPMGIHIENPNEVIILPFRPSQTLENILASGTAVVNYCDDVRIFAGCLTGRRDWPLVATASQHGFVLEAALAHSEVTLIRIEEDPLRPKLICRIVQTINHRPFLGYNRAQFAVLEAAILVSRLDRLPAAKINQELAYLRIGLDKTAGPKELEAWGWLMTLIAEKMPELQHD